jgi:hypothetical protein
VLLCNALLFALVFVLPWYLLLIVYFFLPFFYLNAATAALDEGPVGRAFGLGFKFSMQHYGNSLVVLLLLTLLVGILSQPIAFVLSIHESWNNEPMIRDLLDLFADFVKRVAQIYTGDYMFWSNVARQLVYLIFILGLFPLIAITMAFGFFTEEERTHANGLKASFSKFGKRSRTKEMEADFDE